MWDTFFEQASRLRAAGEPFAFATVVACQRPTAAYPGAKALIKDGFCIGTPDDVIASLKRWESIGCDGIMFLVNSKQVIPQEQVLNSLRLFAKEVMPKFKDPAPIDVTRPGIVTTTANGTAKTKVVADA